VTLAENIKKLEEVESIFTELHNDLEVTGSNFFLYHSILNSIRGLLFTAIKSKEDKGGGK